MPDIQMPSLRRCAIYARKSSNHRLELEVNSLHTQRETCAAYIKSQRYKSWVELPQRYDDAGQTGSSIDRPALSRLMRDIEAGVVDVVVVYKVDRLTRSLNDFVRLIEIFDRYGVSFVSISQSFDTSDSMGRMILNLLLTFSQFEREMIADRIRDSVRTRKRHGHWSGGLPPFGYEITEHGLQVVEEEAEMVRFIFFEFLRGGSYMAAKRAVQSAGLRTVVKFTRKGVPRASRPLSAGSVYNIIRNPIYVGEITGHDRNYPGKHEPIISRETWKAATALSASRVKPAPQRKQTNHFLPGLLWDDCGRPMILRIERWKGCPSFHYASSNTYWSQHERRRPYRANARYLDNLVVACVTDFLGDRQRLRTALKTLGVYGAELDQLAIQGVAGADRLTATPVEHLPELFSALVLRVEIGQEHLWITFRSVELRRLLLWKGSTVFRGRPRDWTCSDAKYVLEVAVRAISAERWPVLDIAARDPATSAPPDLKLIELIETARKAQRLVEEHREQSLEDHATAFGCRPSHFARLVKLNYLSPDIVTAILDGTQPQTLTRETLFKTPLPLDWSLQRKVLGFPARHHKINLKRTYGQPVTSAVASRWS